VDLTLQGKGYALGFGFPAFRAALVQAGDAPPIPRPSALRTPRREWLAVDARRGGLKN